MEEKEKDYVITDNYNFIEISNKDYGYLVFDNCFAIKVDYTRYAPDGCEYFDTEYIEIEFDNLTGQKLKVDEKLQEVIEEAKSLKAKLEKEKQLKYQKQKKLHKKREKQKYEQYIKEFGKEEADKIMKMSDRAEPTNFSNIFMNCYPLQSIPKFKTEQECYINSFEKRRVMEEKEKRYKKNVINNIKYYVEEQEKNGISGQNAINNIKYYVEEQEKNGISGQNAINNIKYYVEEQEKNGISGQNAINNIKYYVEEQEKNGISGQNAINNIKYYVEEQEKNGISGQNAINNIKINKLERENEQLIQRIDELEKNNCPNCGSNDICYHCNSCDMDYQNGLQVDASLTHLYANECKELREENKQLKQRLHDLPKQIVEEIKKITAEIEFRDCRWLGKQAVYDKLDAILKKYGEEKAKAKEMKNE